MTEIVLDGRTVGVPDASTILEAASAHGVAIPALCHLPGLEPYGGCRVCLVEVEGSKTGVMAACSTPVRPGMVIRTDTGAVRALRKEILAFLLAEHDADCFNCKKAGRCELHEYCRLYGVVKSESGLEKRHARPDVSNPFYSMDPSKCILCGKCVRTCEHVQCTHAIGFAGRGRSVRIAPAFDLPIGSSVCVGCGNCVSACPVGALLPRERSFPGYQYVRSVPSVCPYCGVGCSIRLLVSDGRVVGIDPGDGPANEGLLCVKGRFAYGFISHPDRLVKPLVRKDGRFVEVSWDEAFALVASRFLRVRETCGASAMAGLSSARCTNEENYLFQKLFRTLGGTNNVDHCARLCHASTVSGLGRTLGSGAMTNSIHEIDSQDLVFVTGSNTTETHPVIGSRIMRAVARGAKLVVADPRRTELGGMATVFLGLRPGTNVALYNAMASVILSEGLEDRSYIDRATEGFAAWSERVSAWTPERAAGICGLDAGDIRAAAIHYALAGRAGIYYAMGVTQHASGTEGVMCLSNLALLCGKIGKPGCGINPLRGQNNVQGACDMGCLPDLLPGYRRTGDREAAARFSLAWGAPVPAAPGLTSSELFGEVREGSIGYLHIMGENPVLSEPDSAKVRRVLGACEFLVVQDIFMTETAALADVVLPAACFAEKDGTFTNTERRVQLLHAATKPPGEARDDLWILSRIERAILQAAGSEAPGGAGGTAGAGGTGRAEHAPLPDASAVFDEIASLVPQYGGMSHARLAAGGLQWPCPRPDHPGTPILHLDSPARGKGLFVHSEWRPPHESPDDDYPLVFTTGRNLYQYHTRTMTGRIDGLTRIAGEDYIELHPQTADGAGISDGDRVRVSSRRGSVETVARIDASVKPGVVFMPFHYSTAAANVLTNGGALDPHARIPELKACAVGIERIGDARR